MDLSLKKPAVQISHDLPEDLSIKKPRVLTDPCPSSRGNPKPIETPVTRTLADQMIRTIPDQYPRSIVDLKPKTLADQNLRTLAHQKARTLAGQNKRTSADVKPSTLVIPKPSALIIPNPRNRTLVDQRNRTHVRQSGTLAQKLRAHPAQPFADNKSQQGLDLRKKPDSAHVAIVRSSSHRHDQPQNVSAAPDNPTFLRGPIPAVSNGCSSSDAGSFVNEDNPSKRRRKQEYPRKRIKLDSYLPEEVDPAYLISQEFLDKVTDAAHSGQLSKGVDAYFGDAPQGVSDFDNSEQGGENGLSDFAQNSLLKGSGDEVTNGSSTSSRSPDGSLSPFNKSSRSKKLKEARISTSLQNREKRKALRLYGKAYTTPSGKSYPQRRVRDKDCSKCRYNCSVNITAEQRQAIFEHFWSLDSYVKRLYYYCQSIKEKPAKTMKHTRECSREYTFLVDGERVRVCKGFYLATLDVSDKAVRIAMEKRKRGKGMWDKRGAHPPHNKTRPEDKDRVRSHIESFLIIDIYTKTCDNSSTTPGQDLNVTKMHQDYAQECREEGREPVSEDVYRKTFNTEYNLTTVQV